MSSISDICEQHKTERLFVLCTGTQSFISGGKEYQFTINDTHSPPLDRRLAHSIKWVMQAGVGCSHKFLHFYPSADEAGVAKCREFALDNHSPGKVAIIADSEIPLEESRFKQGIDPEVLDNISASLLVTEAERPLAGKSHRVVHVNRGFEELYGYTAAEIVGRSPQLLQGDLSEPDAVAAMHDCLEKWSPCTVEITNYRKDQRIIKAEIHLVPIRDETGWWTHWLGFQRDVGKERDVEQRLARQEFILKTLGIGLWRYNFSSKQLDWDPGMFRLYGREETTFNNNYEDWLAALHPEEEPRADAILEEIISKADTDYDTLFSITTPSGEEKTISARAEHMNLPEGDEEGDEIIYGINWNRTQEVALQRELEAQREVLERRERLANMGELASGIGHEIRNPLQIAISYLDQVMNSVTENGLNSSLREDLQKTQEALQQICAISDGLRNAGRADTVDNTSFDLNALIYEHLALVRPVFKRNDIAISTELGSTRLWINGNKNRLLQVFMNLFSNARDALSGGDDCRIWISTSASGAAARIEISDSGPGIAPEVRDKIFKQAITSKDYGLGSGLGLQISKSIVADLGGSIEIVSGVHSGATFVITVPLCEPPPEASATAPASNADADQRAYVSTVLLVDDEAGIRTILRRQMEQVGIAVFEAGGVDEALVVLTQIPSCDLIICDLNMPEKTGDQLLRELKAKRSATPRFVLLSGSAAEEIDNQIAAVRPDIEKVLKKPFRFKEIEPLLRRPDKNMPLH